MRRPKSNKKLPDAVVGAATDAKIDSQASQLIESAGDVLAPVGESVDKVTLRIDYGLIEHFSEHLYGSPNKAIEELVSNGFDAFATNVFVYLPGMAKGDAVLVWDDGKSMDQSGLKALWWIARSPKRGTARIIFEHDDGTGAQRAVIGKFGIGKLASYALGKTISHLCRQGDDFFFVGVDYETAKAQLPKDDQANSEYITPIVRTTADDARRFIEEFLPPTALGFTTLFEKKRWTLAIIRDLKSPGVAGGRLSWILANGMPLRPDFAVWVDDNPVTSKLAKAAAISWDMGAEDVKKKLLTDWKADAEKSPTKDLIFGSATGLDSNAPALAVPYVEFPNLGRVAGTVRLFDSSLFETDKTGAVVGNRNHGFFVMVRGRLINPNDDKSLIEEPSYSTFYRSQFVLHADGVDSILLADRERLKTGTPIAEELKFLESAIYLLARNTLDARDEEREDPENPRPLLPVRDQNVFRPALTALILKHGAQATAFDIDRTTIERRDLAADQGLAILDEQAGSFIVNSAHPYFQSLRRRLGEGKKARDLYRAMDAVAVAERLLEGQLFDHGVEEGISKAILAERDALFRAMAGSFEHATAEKIARLYETSYLGKKEFELAIADVLRDMGFSAERDGGSGKKDGFVVAPIGIDKHYTFTFEGKGSKHPIPNDAAEISGASNHCKAAGADHAVVVAREFVGFNTPGSPAVLEECECQDPQVSIITIEALERLYLAVLKYGYTLDSIREVFTTIESPDEKLKRIDSLEKPLEDFNYREFLEDVWKLQKGEAASDVVSYRPLWQKMHKNGKCPLTFDEFTARVVALSKLARGRILLTNSNEMVLRQAPDIIVAQIDAALGEG